MYSNAWPIPIEVSRDLKLHADTPTTQNTVTAYGPGFVEINRVRHTTNLIITPDYVEPWPVASFEALDTASFERLRDLRSEVVLLGTGSRQRFPHPRLTRPLTEARVGLEVMDTQAACRTYNILAAESRKVSAALFVEA
jgi:uncharacterized protein